MNDGALCSRIPPRTVSRRAMNERLSLRNSIEQTVSSSNSSRTGRTTGAGFGFAGLAAFAGRAAGPGFVFLFGAAFRVGFARVRREGDAFRFALRATLGRIPGGE